LTTSLARVPLRLPAKRRKLKPVDVSDAKLNTIERATILAYPHAAKVSEWLVENNGRPLGNRVLVLPLPKDDHYGRIAIPTNAQDNQCVGIVVRVGRGTYENGVLVPPDVRVGNYVVFRKYAHSLVKLGDIEVYHVSASDITFAMG